MRVVDSGKPVVDFSFVITVPREAWLQIERESLASSSVTGRDVFGLMAVSGENHCSRVSQLGLRIAKVGVTPNTRIGLEFTHELTQLGRLCSRIHRYRVEGSSVEDATGVKRHGEEGCSCLNRPQVGVCRINSVVWGRGWREIGGARR